MRAPITGSHFLFKLMKKIVIFSFNQIFYDPAAKHFVDGVNLVLRTLKQRGYFLYLITRAEDQPLSLIQQLGVQTYFEKVVVVREKQSADFISCVDRPIDRARSFVVGDKVRQEITFGNQLGFKTVWMRRGPHQHEPPLVPIEEPTHTISTLSAVLDLIL